MSASAWMLSSWQSLLDTTQWSLNEKGWQVLPFPSVSELVWHERSGVLNKYHQELSPCMTFSWQFLRGREIPCFNYTILILQFQCIVFSDRCAITLIYTSMPFLTQMSLHFLITMRKKWSYFKLPTVQVAKNLI